MKSVSAKAFGIVATTLALGALSNSEFGAGRYASETRITKGSGSHVQACWLADGKIAYISNQSGGDCIWVSNADGSDPHRIRRTAATPKVDPTDVHPLKPLPSTGDFHPNSAPQGKIVFVGQMVGANIFVVDEDGSNRVQLTKLSTQDTSPSCNADGKIVFASDRDHMGRGEDLYTMDMDGSNVTRLTHDTRNNSNPSWSPDGKHIAFQSNRDGKNKIYTMDGDGANQKEITPSGYTPSWGADGRIAFVSDPTPNTAEICIVNSDGSGRKQLTNDKVKNFWPSFGPAGKILFQSDREVSGQTRQDIYVLRAP